MTDSPAPAPAYAKLIAVRSHLIAGRRFDAGETFIAIRARSAEDLKVFADTLRWSAFKVEPVDAPRTQAAATSDDLAALIAAQSVDQLAELPGLGVKSAAKLREWAVASLAERAAKKAQAEADAAAAAKAQAEADAAAAAKAQADADAAGQDQPPAV